MKSAYNKVYSFRNDHPTASHPASFCPFFHAAPLLLSVHKTEQTPPFPGYDVAASL
jgi:hypothetical protein